LIEGEKMDIFNVEKMNSKKVSKKKTDERAQKTKEAMRKKIEAEQRFRDRLTGKFIECQTIDAYYARALVVSVNSTVIRVSYKKRKRIKGGETIIDFLENIERSKIMPKGLRLYRK
jgi:hypothetical protein